MAIKKEYQKIVNRFGDVMYCIGCEYLDISSPDSEVYAERYYYGVVDGITIQWMRNEAAYWLSCYYEPGNVRHDDKYHGGYALWRSETGKLRRLISALANLDDDCIEEGISE